MSAALIAWQLAFPGLADPDGFYHLALTELMRTQGIVHEFPWLHFTHLPQIFTDHHLAYHIALLPFVALLPPLLAAKLATFFFALLAVLVVYAVLRSLEVRFPEAWTVLLLLNAPFVQRLLLTKSTALALAVLLIGVACIVHKRHIALFVVALGYSYVHGGFAMLPALVVIFAVAGGVHAALRMRGVRSRIRAGWRAFAHPSNILLMTATVLGIMVGIGASPYFPNNLAFFKEQFIDIGIFTQQTIRVGMEWHPYDPMKFFINNMLIWFPFALLFAVMIAERVKVSRTTIFLVLAALALTIYTIKSRRFIEYAAPFLVMGSAAMTTYLHVSTGMLRRYWFGVVTAVIAVFSIGALQLAELSVMNHHHYFTFDRYQGISRWLQEHVEPGQVIMHTDWDDFPQLFFHNRDHVYIVGLDPTFMYNKDAALYQLYEDLTMGRKTVGLASMVRDTFQSEYVIVNADAVDFGKNIQLDGGFEKVYEDRDGAVWRVKE